MLTKKLQKGEFISIYSGGEEEYFGWGKILAFDEKYIIIWAVDPSGLDSGLSCYSLDMIHKIEKNTLYHESKFRLMNIKQTKCPEYYFVEKTDLKIQLLRLAMTSQKTVDLRLLDNEHSSILGLVSSLDDDVCIVRLIDKYGNPDGEALCNIEDISSIHYDDLDDRDILFLYNK